jgi:hypothetical protein
MEDVAIALLASLYLNANGVEMIEEAAAPPDMKLNGAPPGVVEGALILPPPSPTDFTPEPSLS